MFTALTACVLRIALATDLESGTVVNGALAKKLDDYLGRCTAFGFSGTMLVAKDGEVILRKGYGLAERATHQPNAPDTLFDIGSLTKQFTAAAILCLEQQGKLRTSDTLDKFFPHCPKDKAGIKLHHLLTHTSGLPRASKSINSTLQDRDQFVSLMLGLRLESEPGKKYSYSNIGFGLLGVIVELASDKPFEQYLNETLFAPAHLTSTSFRGDGKSPATRAARGYQSPPEPGEIGSTVPEVEQELPWEPSLAVAGWYSWGLRGAGGVITTVDDLYRWHQALQGDSILGARSRSKLFTPFLDDYAYGWFIFKTRHGTRWIEHGGSTENGFEVKFIHYPDDHVVQIALGNTRGAPLPWVNLNVSKIIFGEDVTWPPAVVAPDPAQWQTLSGVYVGDHDQRFSVSVREDGIALEAENAQAFQLISPADPVRSAALKKTEDLARRLAAGDLTAVHALEDKASPLRWFDGWWRDLEEKHGGHAEIQVIAACSEPTAGETTLVKVRYERGAEILRLGWTGDKLTGIHKDGPFPSLLKLAPTSATHFVRFDLQKSKVVCELDFTLDTGGSVRSLSLVAGGKTTKLLAK